MAQRTYDSFVSNKKQGSRHFLFVALSLFLLCVLCASSFAAQCTGCVFTDDFIIGENNSIFGYMLDDAHESYYSPHNATISVYGPNNSLLVNNTPFTEFETGKFIYSFIPEQQGNYFILAQYENTTKTLAIAGVSAYADYKPLTEANMIPLTILIGLIGIIVYVLYLSKDMLKKPAGDIDKGIYKWVNPQNVGAFFHILSAWLVAIIVYILVLLAEGTTYAGIMTTIFTGVMWIVGVYTFIYITLYMVFLSISAYDRKMIRNN